MSVIVDLVVLHDGSEDKAMAQLNAWCAENDTARQQQFERIGTDEAGGNKVFCSEVWAMAGNHFPHYLLSEAFPSFGWLRPEKALLVINHEMSDVSEVVRAVAEQVAK